MFNCLKDIEHKDGYYIDSSVACRVLFILISLLLVRIVLMHILYIYSWSHEEIKLLLYKYLLFRFAQFNPIKIQLAMFVLKLLEEYS